LDIKYEIEDIEHTCWACPSQWEGTLTDGRMFYIRYRWGHLTFYVSENPTINLYDALNTEPLVSKQCGEEFDGVMGLDEVMVEFKKEGVILDSKQ